MMFKLIVYLTENPGEAGIFIINLDIVSTVDGWTSCPDRRLVRADGRGIYPAGMDI